MQPGKRGLNKSVNVTRNLKNTAPILMTGLHMAHLLGYKWLITGHNLGVYERYSPYVIHKHFLRIISKLDTILTFVLKRQDTCGTFCLTIVDCVGQMIGGFVSTERWGWLGLKLIKCLEDFQHPILCVNPHETLGQSLKTADSNPSRTTLHHPVWESKTMFFFFFLSFP